MDNAILPGCTRGSLLALIGEAGVTAAEGAFSAEEMRHAREMFITSATGFVKPVISLDGAPIGDGTVGPVTRRLFELYARHVAGGVNSRT